MRRLAHAREHLDGALTDPRVLDGNLRDLRRVNRAFGGSSLSVQALRALVLSAAGRETADRSDGDLHVLDVGTGGADIPMAMVGAGGPWRSVHVTAVDSRREVLEAARRVTPGLVGSRDVSLELADGRSLPYPDRAFDVAHASLVLHHLEPEDAAAFIAELARVARLGVVVNDLARGFVPWIGAWLVLHAMTRNSFTLHDGPLSVRRAYTPAEARGLLAGAGLVPVRELHGLAGHRWAIAAGRP